MFMGLGLLFVFGLVVLCSLLGQGLSRLLRGRKPNPHPDTNTNSSFSGLEVVLLFVLFVPPWWSSPSLRRLTPDDIRGTYRIDRSFYPGRNADWQYEHYRFELNDDTLVLTEIGDDRVAHKHIGKLTWSDQNTRRALWSAKMPEPHHLHFEAPQLFRSYWSFYYVIHSDKFGTMFFRKEGDFFRREYLLGLVLIPLVLWWKPRHYRPKQASPKPTTGP